MKSIFKKSLYLIMVFCLLFLCVGLTTNVNAADEIQGDWKLVTDASSLTIGDKVIIVSTTSKVAMSTTQNSNNRGQTSVTIKDDICTINDNVQQLSLEKGNKDGTFAFYTGTGYLYAASSSSNHLKTESKLSDNSSWTIEIASNNATIKAQGTNTRNLLKYNSSSSLFSCYNSGQQAISLFKFVEIQDDNKHIVSFDSDGGTLISNQKVDNNSTATLPTEPTKTGYEFLGWFTEGSDTAFDFSTPITDDITLYAKWKETAYFPLLSMETKASLYAAYTTTVSSIPNIKYELVKDASSIKAGDKIVIASQSKGVLASEEITKDYLNITTVSETALADTLPGTTLVEGVFTIGGEAGKWTLANSQGKLLGTTAAKSVSYGSGTTTWTISIASNGDATIASTNSSYGRILYNSGSPRFTTYTSNTTSSMLLPQIYKVIEDTSSTIEVIEYEVTSLAMRFGMVVEKELYDNIVASGEMKFGVCVMKGSSFNEAKATLVECTPVRVNANGEEDINGVYYQFAAVITDIPESDRTTLVSASVCVYNSSDNTIIAYAVSKTMSVKTLAEAYGNLEGYEGILEYLRR